MMDVVSWAQSVKPDLIKLQQTKGIPALWAAAQMCHESAANGGAELSGLAREANNFAGLKWAEWERGYGCQPATYGTWEVLDGQHVDLSDAFCKCPSWEVWLKVYGDLLTSRTYSSALAYAGDPLLYGLHVAQCGWATDPNYLIGVSHWMDKLYNSYTDTIAAAIQPQAVTIADETGKPLCQGWLQESQTVVPVRSLADALGYDLTWNGDTSTITLKK